jgi:putative transcriptional regulator
MQVVNSIKKFRTGKNLTQEQLAEAVSVSRQTIISIEKGNYIPSLMLAMQLAKVFRVKIEDLFTLD